MPAYRDDQEQWRYQFRHGDRTYDGAPPEDSNTRAAAVAAEQAHIAQLTASAFHAGRMPTVRDFVPMLLDHKRTRCKPLTVRHHEAVLRVHVVPAIGEVPLDEIGTRMLADLTTRWVVSGAAPRTVNGRLWVVARMLAIAAELEIVTGAPRPRYLRVTKRLPRFLSDDEARRLLGAATDAWRSMIFVALRTGLRIGELRGLQWADVDFPLGVIVVRRTDPGRTGFGATTPKSGSERVIALSPEALATLRHLRSTTDHGEPQDWVWYGRTRDGSLSSRRMRSCWQAITSACRRAEIRIGSWHVLRHTCASWLVMRGVSLRIIQAILGHSSIRHTEIYAHLAPNAIFYGAMATLDTPLIPMFSPVLALPPGSNEGSTR